MLFPGKTMFCVQKPCFSITFFMTDEPARHRPARETGAEEPGVKIHLYNTRRSGAKEMEKDFAG